MYIVQFLKFTLINDVSTGIYMVLSVLGVCVVSFLDILDMDSLLVEVSQCLPSSCRFQLQSKCLQCSHRSAEGDLQCCCPDKKGGETLRGGCGMSLHVRGGAGEHLPGGGDGE